LLDADALPIASQLFVWQMDAETRFSIESGDFIRLTGPRTAEVMGQPWAEIVRRLGIDPDGQVARAIATRDTWSGITFDWPVDGTDERLTVALDELYAFYRQTEPMLDNLFRDEKTMPLVQERFAAFRSYLTAARNTLMAGRNLPGASRRRTQAALGHTIAFSTWKSLVREEGLDETDAAALARALVAAS